MEKRGGIAIVIAVVRALPDNDNNSCRRLTATLVILGVVRPPEAGAKAEVGQLDVAVAVDQDVVRLDVPADGSGGVCDATIRLRKCVPARQVTRRSLAKNVKCGSERLVASPGLRGRSGFGWPESGPNNC